MTLQLPEESEKIRHQNEIIHLLKLYSLLNWFYWLSIFTQHTFTVTGALSGLPTQDIKSLNDHWVGKVALCKAHTLPNWVTKACKIMQDYAKLCTNATLPISTSDDSTDKKSRLRIYSEYWQRMLLPSKDCWKDLHKTILQYSSLTLIKTK